MKRGTVIFGLAGLLWFGLAGCNSYDDDVVPDDVANKLVLVNDEYKTALNKPVKLTVLDNDKIGGNGSLTFQTPPNGTVQIKENDFYYTPALNFTGTDQFYYRYCMTSTGACDSASVTIVIN